MSPEECARGKHGLIVWEDGEVGDGIGGPYAYCQVCHRILNNEDLYKVTFWQSGRIAFIGRQLDDAKIELDKNTMSKIRWIQESMSKDNHG